MKKIFLILLLLISTRIALAQSPFITTWETTSSNESITIPTNGGVDITDYDFTIDWGDGTVEDITGDDPDPSHEYVNSGIYTVQISGVFPHFYMDSPTFSPNPSVLKLLTVEQWGDIEWESMDSMFEGDKDFVLNATDIPDLSGVTNMSSMFAQAESFNGDLSGWDVSSVIEMDYMFREATSFNGDLSGWDVSNVTDMSAMFAGTESFSQDLSNWDVSSVTDMSVMFSEATVFNGDLSGWDVSSVADMSYMFFGTELFNGDISNWDVSSVIEMDYMFREATNFNRDLSDWDVSNVTDMSVMFAGTELFNGDLSGWDVSNVADMSAMFAETESFSQDLSNWDVSSVTDMSVMFSEATVFNGDLSGWDVSSVADMSYMFYGATFFNHDIGDWNVSNVKDMREMFKGASLSSDNYDSLLTNWSKLELQKGLIFDAGFSQYSIVSKSARESIINKFEWTILDGGLVDNEATPEFSELPDDFIIVKDQSDSLNIWEFVSDVSIIDKMLAFSFESVPEGLEFSFDVETGLVSIKGVGVIGKYSAIITATNRNNTSAKDTLGVEIVLSTSTENGVMVVPSGFALNQNYPNPFNPSTKIEYTLARKANVTLFVYNSLGQQVTMLVNSQQNAGFYEVNFDASLLSSGVYVYRITADEFSETKKMLLIK